MQSPTSVSTDQIQQTFQRVWGYAALREPQEQVVRCLLARRDALVVLPTGYGKSICFQLPALLQTGVTLVVSPLVALMEDQVQDLQQRGSAAASLHSELPADLRRRVLRALGQNRLRLLYLSPETLMSPAVWEQLTQPELTVANIIVDEAHCLTVWGSDFRPDYRRLGAVRAALLRHKPKSHGRIGLAAFTATAEPTTQAALCSALGLRQPARIGVSPYRANLNLKIQVVWSAWNRRQQVGRFIQARPGQAGLVYVRSRHDAEELATWLGQQGHRTASYHAGLIAQERRQLEQSWLSGELAFVVATCALGMGLNHPRIRWVVHFQPPLTLAEYVQEVGRAGRDGEPAQALMLVSEPTGWLDPGDRQQRNYFLAQQQSQRQKVQRLLPQLPKRGELSTLCQRLPGAALALAQLQAAGRLVWRDPFCYELLESVGPLPPVEIQPVQQMQTYISSQDCRWRFLLSSFGFEREAEAFRCGHCDRC
ncbi:ATP-dependent DNA helicase RecQ [Leptolyngbya sp. FACHB-261]|nr:ATP-dependent DNA helicase RecQ [Leptolyngbya sp. FACHB-261]